MAKDLSEIRAGILDDGPAETMKDESGMLSKVIKAPSLITLGLLPRAAGMSHVAGAILLLILDILLPLAFIVANSALIGSVPAAIEGGFGSPAAERLFSLLVIVFGLFVAPHVFRPFLGVATETLGSKLDRHLKRRVMAVTAMPQGIAHLEDPGVADAISKAQGIGEAFVSPGSSISTIATWTSVRVRGALSALILFGFSWWVPLLLAVGWVVSDRWMQQDIGSIVKSRKAGTSDLRRAGYFRDLALAPSAAKELRIFGVSSWIIDHFRVHWLKGMGEAWEERRANRIVMARGVLLLVGGNLLVLFILARAAVQGEISLAELTLYGQALILMSGLGYFADQWRIQHGTASVPEVLALEKLLAEDDRVNLSGDRSAADLPASSLSFDNVRFRYPGRDDYVFQDLTLEIPAGRSLAIVGENGAGKTTLVKLLARLYDPDSGRILVDGVDLRELNPNSWRSRMGVVFQDYLQYQFSALENVSVGNLEQGAQLESLDRAASKAGARQLIEGLPKGWETVLSRQYEDGRDLSGGEWQRIALARAFFAIEGGASILILDEPTANLDVRAEAEIYERFLELTRGLTTILISHRFSTVRRADRICVLENGQVIEDGTHAELMSKDGRYASMFRMQASRFSEQAEAG